MVDAGKETQTESNLDLDPWGQASTLSSSETWKRFHLLDCYCSTRDCGFLFLHCRDGWWVTKNTLEGKMPIERIEWIQVCALAGGHSKPLIFFCWSRGVYADVCSGLVSCWKVQFHFIQLPNSSLRGLSPNSLLFPIMNLMAWKFFFWLVPFNHNVPLVLWKFSGDPGDMNESESL